MRRTISVLIVISVALFAVVAIADESTAELWEVLAKASPDECFYAVGSDYNQYPLTGSCEDGQLKTNEGYVWGLTKHGANLFFGTAPNVQCLVMQGYLGMTEPVLTKDYVCEFCEGPGFPLGDMRPSSMYMYNQAQGLVSLNDSIPEPSRSLIPGTLGIRSAGSHKGVVFLAGPTPPGSGGVNLFAFNAGNGAFLTATTMTEYSNIRNWLVVGNELYVGVGGAEGGAGSGAVLRWTGRYSSDPEVLFTFEVVGDEMDGIASNLTEHQGRIYTSTWPALGSNNVAGIWMSPLIQDLSPENSNGWVKIWSASDYEPDYVTALAYYGGAIASFDGCLYWGTMHVPGLAARIHIGTYYTEQNPPTEEELGQIYAGTARAASIFRARNPGTPYQTIQVLYGGSLLSSGGNYSTYNPATGWQFLQNLMGQSPLYGLEGFDNPLNNYCWTMRTPKKQGWNGLYVGTMDCGNLYGYTDDTDDIVLPADYELGADLYRFDSSQSSAVPVSIDGMGNPMNYGIRTMISDENALYLGTANPMNLNPDGGWELIELIPKEHGKHQKHQ